MKAIKIRAFLELVNHIRYAMKGILKNAIISVNKEEI